jgi:flagellar protein FlbD
MIRLTRLNKRTLVVNADLIKFIENAPDTVITLVTGEKIVVLETAEDVINRIVDFRRRLAPQVSVSRSEGPLATLDEPREDGK